MTTPTSRPARRAMAAGAAAIALIAAAGCGDSTSGDSGADPASVLPANSPFYAEVKVRPEGALKEDVIAVARKISRNEDPFGEIIRSIEEGEDSDTTFKDDIEPWLGDRVGVSITSLQNTAKPDFAVAIATTDTGAAYDAAKKDFDGKEGEYKGVKFVDDDGDLAGVVGDALVIGSPDGFRATVDAEQADEQLDDSAGLGDIREGIDEDSSLGLAYIDVQRALDAALASQPLIASQVGPLKEALGGATVAGASFTVEDDAIRVEGVGVGGPAPAGEGDPAAALAALPGDTVLGAGLGPVGPTIQQVVDQVLGAGPIAGQDPQAILRTFEGQFGLRLKEDLLSWMGEGAVFVQGRGIQDIGGGLVVTSTNPDTTRATLGKLVPLLRAAGAQVRSTPPEGASAGFRVAVGGGAVGIPEVLVGLQENRFVVGVNPQVVEAILSGDTAGSLGESAAFKAAAGKLTDGIKPSFYLDLPTLVSFATLVAGGQPEFQQAKPYLDAFSAVVAGSKRDGDRSLSQLVVGIK